MKNNQGNSYAFSRHSEPLPFSAVSDADFLSRSIVWGKGGASTI